METKYIFVTGGVVSSLGKGIISASMPTLPYPKGETVLHVAQLHFRQHRQATASTRF